MASLRRLMQKIVHANEHEGVGFGTRVIPGIRNTGMTIGIRLKNRALLVAGIAGLVISITLVVSGSDVGWPMLGSSLALSFVGYLRSRNTADTRRVK